MTSISLELLTHPTIDKISEELNKNKILYSAQRAAREIFKNNSFPPNTVIKPNTFFNKVCKVIREFNLLIYKIYSLFKNIIVFGISKTLLIGDYIIGWMVRPIIDFIFPINPINKKRQFHLLPKIVEKTLGKLLYNAYSSKLETNEISISTRNPLAGEVRKVFDKMLKENKELLNPSKEKVKFDYQVRTIPSSKINAFALPGGGITVLSRIVREIDYTINNKTITHTDVQFPNGSKIRVDLTDVNLEDTLAVLLGHEMTHIASRHSNILITFSIISGIIKKIANFILVNFFKEKNVEYLRMKNKKLSELSAIEIQRLKQLEKNYSKINDLLEWLEDHILSLFNLFKSRQAEYEADVTGIYFAKKANFNVLGALYLFEFFKRQRSDIKDFIYKNFEFLFTHPYHENRKLAAFAAINEIDQKRLQNHIL